MKTGSNSIQKASDRRQAIPIIRLLWLLNVLKTKDAADKYYHPVVRQTIALEELARLTHTMFGKDKYV